MIRLLGGGLKATHLCTLPAFPMEKMGALVLSTLADKVFTEDRVQQMLAEMKRLHTASRADLTAKIKPLQKELEDNRQASERLYEAVEKGLLPMDETLQARAHKLKVRREDILLEMASLK